MSLISYDRAHLHHLCAHRVGTVVVILLPGAHKEAVGDNDGQQEAAVNDDDVDVKIRLDDLQHMSCKAHHRHQASMQNRGLAALLGELAGKQG